MADISTLNIGGADYGVKDATARTNATAAMSIPAYYETGNTASQAYSTIGTPINWKGTLYYTKTAVAKGATWASGTNLTAATNLGKLTRNIKTWVNANGELVFRDLTGADTVLNFSGGGSGAVKYLTFTWTWGLYASHTFTLEKEPFAFVYVFMRNRNTHIMQKALIKGTVTDVNNGGFLDECVVDTTAWTNADWSATGPGSSTMSLSGKKLTITNNTIGIYNNAVNPIGAIVYC